MIKFIFTASIVFIFSSSAFSQVEEITDSTKIITLNNGDTRVGEIISDDGREILFLTKDIGKVFIRKQDIKSIRPYVPEAGEIVDGNFLANSPFTTRYYFTTNARPLKKGEDYVMIHLYGPEVHFSVNDRLSVGVMTTWIASPFVLAAKYSIPTKNPNVNFGIGTLLGTSGYLNTFRGFGGLHWGMATFGDERQNVTVSLGYSYMNPGSIVYNSTGVNSLTKLSKAPVLSFAGIKKIGKRASFFFDSMIFFGKSTKTSSNGYVYNPITGSYDYVGTSATVYRNTIAFFMPGMRFQSGPKSAFQFALAGVIYSEKNTKTNYNNILSFPVPQCSWFIKF
jgi:hypothetical protein